LVKVSSGPLAPHSSTCTTAHLSCTVVCDRTLLGETVSTTG
jgi:hypothetical protein